MTTLASRIDRAPNFIDLQFRDEPGVEAYEVRSAPTLNDAYVGTAVSPLNGVVGLTGTILLFEAQAGVGFRSRNIAQNRLATVGDSQRGTTRCYFSMSDFATAVAAGAPGDTATMFFRVRERLTTLGALGPEGPIIVQPTAEFYDQDLPALTMAGNAPAIAGAVAGALPPPGSMVIAVPRTTSSFSLRNLDGAADLLFSFGRGQPLAVLPAGEELGMTSTGASQFHLVAVGANPAFSLVTTIVGAPL